MGFQSKRQFGAESTVLLQGSYFPELAIIGAVIKFASMISVFSARVVKFSVRLLLAALVVLIIAAAGFRWAAERRETAGYGTGVPEQGRFAATAEGGVFLLEAGQPEAPPVLFAHGTAAWSGLWLPTLETLGRAGFHAIAYDMVPFGWSQHPADGDYSRRRQADRVVALLEALDSRPVVVAHSVGAGPAAEAVLRRPDLVSGLVIVDGAIALGSHQAAKGVPVYLRNRILREHIAAATASNPLLTRQFLRGFMHVKQAATAETVALLQEPLRRQGYTEALADWLPQLFVPPRDALSTRADHWQALDLPVALIWGREDTVTPLAQAEELAGLIPGAQLTILEGVGHIPQIENPEAFRDALIPILHAISKSAAGDFEP